MSERGQAITSTLLTQYKHVCLAVRHVHISVHTTHTSPSYEQ
jgi:predicted helicase